MCVTVCVSLCVCHCVCVCVCQDVFESRRYLQVLNGKTATATALVLFLLGGLAFTGADNWGGGGGGGGERNNH